MSQLSYTEALEYIEKNNIKVTKKIKKALDELYPSGHELVHVDEVDEVIEENIETDEDYERAWGPTKWWSQSCTCKEVQDL